jgi:hypothetical protein
MDALYAYLEGHKALLGWVSGVSAAMFVGSLLLVPWLVARAPEDIFVREKKQHRAPLALLGALLRNLAGVLLLGVGVLLLVLPGQGLLLILLGLLLVDVPGKRRLIQRIVRRPSIWHGLGYLRERAERPPFIEP